MTVGTKTRRQLVRDDIAPLPGDNSAWPVFICVLGTFRVLRAGHSVSLRGGKTQALLGQLALHYADGVSRADLLDALWPTSDTALAGEALYSRIYGLHKLLGAAIGGLAPVTQVEGRYRLNSAAGIGVDVARFDDLATAGDLQARTGRVEDAVTLYEHAVQFYHGDLCVGTDLHAVVERERLRARYLTLLAALGSFAYDVGDGAACLAYSQRVLSQDPCREDAHRLVMRYHVRRGERAQALHQFHVCAGILRTAFEATPEPETVALFEQVLRAPATV
ncbi:MAG: AfsR/SARP family transcriptional regulator [Chloroflexota bacterium]